MNALRLAFRQLAKTPAFTTVAVLTLALGLTVNAAVFSFVSAFYLQPLPAANPAELVVIAQKSAGFAMPYPLSYLDSVDFRQAIESPGPGDDALSQAYSGMTAYLESAVHLSREGETMAERTWLHVVSNNYFSVLGVAPLHGRTFLPTEGLQPGADPIIVLTHPTWRKRFNADPAIVGRSVKLNGVAFTVIGIMPPGFVGAAAGTDLCGFVPATMVATIAPDLGNLLTSRGNSGFFLMGRMRPGVAFDQARAAASLMLQRLVAEYPDEHAQNITAAVMRESRSRPVPYVASYAAAIVAALAAMSVLVMLIAIANVANLLFARTANREHELAIRGSLGATRSRLLRQLLAESIVLALAAGVVGTIAALWINPYLESIGPPAESAQPIASGTDWRLFVFTLVGSLLTGLLTGLLPALKATRSNVVGQLSQSGRSASRSPHLWRSGLIVAQVGISCVVLVCAGLGLRSLARLSTLDLGFQQHDVLLASLDLERQRYEPERIQTFQRQVLEDLRALPGVRAASLGAQMPFDIGASMRGDIAAEGQPPPEGQYRFIPYLPVEHTFATTLGLRLEAGRDFAERDNASAPRVAIINRALAQQLWPDQDPIGQRLQISGTPAEVIGLLGETRFWAITDRARPLVFVPLAQNPRGRVTLAIRTDGPPELLTESVRRVVQRHDPDLPLFNIRSMAQQISSSPLGLMPMRAGAAIAIAQGLLALLLAALGIAGLVSFSVTLRTREIGIRMALGATTPQVLRAVLGRSLGLTLLGVAVGLLLAFGLTRPLANLLYDVSATDPVVFCAVVGLILSIALLAGWLPARRAMRVNPVEALRSE